MVLYAPWFFHDPAACAEQLLLHDGEVDKIPKNANQEGNAERSE